MNTELKNIVGRVKKLQSQLQVVLKDKTWIEEARKYAKKQSKEVRKLITTDVNKVKVFIEKERKELQKFQKQIPGEVTKIRKLVLSQSNELEKVLNRIRRVKASGKTVTKKKASGTKKKATTKKAASAGNGSAASASTSA